MQSLKIALLVFILQTKLIFRLFFLTLITLLLVCRISYPQVGEWRVFNTQNSSVPQNAFYCIGIDHSDKLWLAHHSICEWDIINSACYYNYPYLGSDIVAIHGDSEGYVWLSLEAPWIIKTNGNYWETQFLDNAMWAITIDQNNVLWGGGGQRPLEGLHKFDGNNWTVFDTSNSPLPYPYVSQLTSDNQGKIWGIAVGNSGRAIFNYDGNNWEIIPAYFPPVWVSTMTADNKGNIWYATAVPQTSFAGIVQIINSTSIFHPKPDSISGFAQKLLVDSDDNLWVCWSNCVSEYSEGTWSFYKDTIDYTFSDMTIDSKDNIWLSTIRDGVIAFNKNGLVLSTDERFESRMIADFLLSQNYPNPFNPVTKIKYTIPSTPLSFGEWLGVRLIVYDLLGNEVTTLVNEFKPAGKYEAEFNASDLPSGVYFYQLLVSDLQNKDGNAGGYSDTKKMILFK